VHHVGTLRAIPTAMNGTPKPGGRCNALHPALHYRPLLFLVASIVGCGAVGAGPSQPPSNITVTVTPTTANVLLGEQQIFVATVNNSTNSNVIWSVNGISGGNAAVGTINANGTYTAPINLPVPNSVSVRATSAEDTTKNSSAQATVTSDISVSISPSAASVELGATQPFAAAVTSAGNPNRSVSWVLSGAGCAGAACGSVDSSGTYTAPEIIPAPPSVNLIAISVADSTKIATATVNITSSFSLSVSGPASVNAGAPATYVATLAPAANSNPSRAISWSIAGTGCSANSCGTITQVGLYTAPAIPPSPAIVKIIATSQADPAKVASASLTILPVITVVISPSSISLPLGNTQAFQAVVTGAVDTTVTWDVIGVVDGNLAVGSILNSQITPNSTTYTAPQSLPVGGFVTVRARSNADPSFSGSVIVMLISAVNVDLNPSTASVAINERQSFTVQVNGTTNQNVSWLVNGIAGGNAIVGQICAAGSNPCQPVSTSVAGSVDFVAPAGMPSPNPVTITATSQADATRSSSAIIAVLPHIVVSVQPGSASLSEMEPTRFTANLAGTANQNVIWMITGAGCGIPGNCGSIDSTGLYIAPGAKPSPDLIDVVATSTEDIGQSGTATVTIVNSPAIFALAPTSAYAGTAGGFTLLLSGINFAATIPGPGSTILVSGSPRSTTCDSSTQCNTSLGAADLQSAGNLTVQLQNPDGTLSNTEMFVVLAQGAGTGTIPLTPSAPNSTGNDIVVVELSTNGGAGASGNVSLNIAAIGAFSAATGSCTLAGNPVIIQRPVSGNGSGDLCVFSVSALSASFSYTVSGPSTPDITVINREPLGLGIVHLRLLVPATAAPGPRTLFIVNPNGDQAAGTGTIEVQ
jgi:hypothetical protein